MKRATYPLLANGWSFSPRPLPSPSTASVPSCSSTRPCCETAVRTPAFARCVACARPRKPRWVPPPHPPSHSHSPLCSAPPARRPQLRLLITHHSSLPTPAPSSPTPPPSLPTPESLSHAFAPPQIVLTTKEQPEFKLPAEVIDNLTPGAGATELWLSKHVRVAHVFLSAPPAALALPFSLPLRSRLTPSPPFPPQPNVKAWALMTDLSQEHVQATIETIVRQSNSPTRPLVAHCCSSLLTPLSPSSASLSWISLRRRRQKRGAVRQARREWRHCRRRRQQPKARLRRYPLVSPTPFASRAGRSLGQSSLRGSR